MKIKYIIWVGLTALCAVGIVGFFMCRKMPITETLLAPKIEEHPAVFAVTSQATPALPKTSKSQKIIAHREFNKRLNERFTLEELEKLGHLPNEPWPDEERLAEKTTWWGKPINPAVFWRDRPVWKDRDVSWAANSRGRQCPPIPFDDPDMSKFPTNDTQNKGSAGVEGYTPAYVENLRERNFWAKWYYMLPQPPYLIENAQFSQAEIMMSAENRSRIPLDQQRGRGITARDVDEYWQTVGGKAKSDGCPPEAFERRAIYATFVLNQYGKQENTRPASIEQWRGIVPDEYLNASKVQLIEMHKEWQRAYVERLGKELPKHPQLAPFADRYIKAYKEAWGL